MSDMPQVKESALGKVEGHVRDRNAFFAVHFRFLKFIQQAMRLLRTEVLCSCASIMNFTSKSSICLSVQRAHSGVLGLTSVLPTTCSFIQTQSVPFHKRIGLHMLYKR